MEKWRHFQLELIYGTDRCAPLWVHFCYFLGYFGMLRRLSEKGAKKGKKYAALDPFGHF